MLKKFLISIAALILIMSVSLMWLTRDFGPTHEGLKNANLPPLISTGAFYADPRSAYGYISSSDGKYVSNRQSSLSGKHLVVRDVATMTEIAEFPDAAQFVRWHPSKPLLRFIFEQQDWEVDPWNPDRKNWKRITPVALSGGWFRTEIADNPDMDLLVWGKSNNRSPAHIWLVSQDGLTAEKVAEGNADTVYWVFDETRKPRIRVDGLDEATRRLFVKDGEEWQKLIDLDLDDTFEPFSSVDSEGLIFARSSRGRDRVAWVQFDISDGSETVLYENPISDVGWPTPLRSKTVNDILRTGIEDYDRIALTPKGQVFLDILDDFPQPMALGATSYSAGGRFVTQALSPDEKSFIYLLIDLQEKSYVTLGEFHFRRFSEHLTSSKSIRFKARDGLDIPAIITLPKGVTGPIPFVVQIHGGPAHHFSPKYNHEAQFLTNRGYGVLEVNFRGSTGFGKEFQAAGFKEFGRKMQDDITDAALWLVDQGLADTDALVAMGTSYGGYAAAMALTRDKGLFDAAVVEFPMLDVEFQTRHHPGSWNGGMNQWWRYFGQVDNAADLEDMHKFSPINRVEDIEGEMLVIGGLRDQVTAIQQVRNFEEAVKVAGKDVTFEYFPDAGHGTNTWSDALRRARLIEDFLAENVGGRSGGLALMEWVPDYFK